MSKKTWSDLPHEIKMKIIYKSGMIEPSAEIIKELIREENWWRERRWDVFKNNVEEVDFIQSLKDRKVLKQVQEGFTIEALVDIIWEIHYQYPDGPDEYISDSDTDSDTD